MAIKKATLVLEGGATRGVFTSGALDYLMKAFGNNGERVGSNGNDAERCDNHRRCDLRSTNGHVFESHR